MKKTAVIFLIGIFFLFGCSKSSNAAPQEYSSIEWVYFAENQYDDSRGLDIYKNTGDPYLPYINIYDFMRYIRNSTNIEVKDEVFECDTSISGEDKTVRFDASKNSLFILDDTNFYGKGALTMGQGEVFLLSPAEAVTIDLSQYGFEIIEDEGEFYIPFDLANIVLNERGNIALYNQEVITVRYFGTSDQELVPDELNHAESKDFEKYKERYLNLIAFHLDYYFGYNDYLEIEDFYQDMMKTSLKRSSNYFDYQVALTNYFLDFDDKHTVNHSSQQYEDTTKFNRRILFSNFLKFFNTENDYELFLCTNEKQEIEVYGHIAYVKINSFMSSEVIGLMNELIQLEGITDVVFDVSCNGGGEITQGFSILKYIANKPVDIYFKNTLSGKVEMHRYQPLEDFYLDKEFYFVSSSASYSATNMLLNVVEMNDLGKIIGKPSSGGACSSQIKLLSGTNYYNYSSHFCYTDREMNIIEEGVEPDIYYEPKKDSDIISEVIGLIEDLRTE